MYAYPCLYRHKDCVVVISCWSFLENFWPRNWKFSSLGNFCVITTKCNFKSITLMLVYWEMEALGNCFHFFLLIQNGFVMCRRMVCDCENPTVDLFCCPECDPRLSSQCLHQNGETLYNSGDTWVQNCQQCRCLVSLATGRRGKVRAQNLTRETSLPSCIRR